MQCNFYDEKYGGPLLNRYNNQLRQFRKNLGYDYKNKPKKTEDKKDQVEKPSDIHIANENELSTISKLNKYYTPWEVFLSDWKSVFAIRQKDFEEMEFSQLLSKWPILGNHEIAPHLVSSSFLNIYTFLNMFLI